MVHVTSTLQTSLSHPAYVSPCSHVVDHVQQPAASERSPSCRDCFLRIFSNSSGMKSDPRVHIRSTPWTSLSHPSYVSPCSHVVDHVQQPAASEKPPSCRDCFLRISSKVCWMDDVDPPVHIRST